MSDDRNAVVVDPSEAQPVLDYISDSNLTLTHALITHHHADHTAGCAELVRLTGCQAVGPLTSATQLIDEDLPPDAVAIRTPGHTASHVCYHFQSQNALFSGDTLFLGGCGRLFEGTPAQMWASLLKLRDLPAETEVYPGHDYTLDNLQFCQSILPEDTAIRDRIALLSSGQAPSHSPISDELITNVFLMCDNPAFQRATGLTGSPEEVFAQLRSRKDSW